MQLQLTVTDPLVMAEIKRLRRESMKYRLQRNDARAAAERLGVELA